MDNRRGDQYDDRHEASRSSEMPGQNDDWDDDEDYASDGGKSLLLWIGGGVLALVLVAFFVFFGRGGGGSSSGEQNQMEEIRKLQARVEQLETDAKSRQEVVDRLNNDQTAFQEEWLKMVARVEEMKKTMADLSQRAGAPGRTHEAAAPPLLPPGDAATDQPSEPPLPSPAVTESSDSQSGSAADDLEAEKKREAEKKKAAAERKKAAAEKKKAEAEKKKAEADKKAETEKKPDSEKADAGTAEKPKKTPIPKDGYVVVEPGLNLYRISMKYGVSQAELKRLNGLTGDQVNIGQKIYLRQKK